MPEAWHAAQAGPRCRPTSGHFAWANEAPFHDGSETLWHVSHAVGNPAAAWFGFAAFW